MFKRKQNLVGLDIGSHSVKVVQIKEKGGGLRLLNLGLLELQQDMFFGKRAENSDLLAKKVQRLCSHLKLKNRSAAMSISGYEVMIKKIELPMMTEEELESRMHLELGQYIPYNIEDVEIDYQIMDVSKDRTNFMEVLLVAAKKDSVSQCMNLLKQCGFEPGVIDVDFFALSNAYEAVYGLTNKENVALLDIGATKGAINIMCDGVPSFTRDIPIGGQQITDGIKERFRLSQHEAEAVKLGQNSDRIDSQELESVVVGVVRNWIGEVRRAIDFYRRNYPENEVGKLFLSGGSCRLSGLAKVFQDALEIPVEILNPIARLDYDPREFDPDYVDYIGPQMTIAFGLALRKTSEK